MGVRRNQSKMTGTERTAFVTAVLELKRRGGYDELVQIHNDRMMSDYEGTMAVAHRAPSFLPWHREFLLKFERALQAINSQVTIPYWDWTVDTSKTGSPWSGSFLGGDGRSSDGQVTTGPFAYSTGNWTLTVRLDDRPFLTREMGVSTPTLPTHSQLSAVLSRSPYDTSPWGPGSPSGFRNGLEGFTSPWLHNLVHDWVGGHMLTTVSPNDPVFWLHHSFIDKCWSGWCAAHPPAAYLPTSGTPDVVDANEPLPPWNDMTPASLVDHSRFYSYG
jgi:tyrosinase